MHFNFQHVKNVSKDRTKVAFKALGTNQGLNVQQQEIGFVITFNNITVQEILEYCNTVDMNVCTHPECDYIKVFGSKT